MFWNNKMSYTYFIAEGYLVNNNNNKLFMSDVTVLPHASSGCWSQSFLCNVNIISSSHNSL